ncbi:A/G-specific DNA-adenine glycosylase [Aequorivita sublithincola DSM 14238]|uniref:Adenine DNA glycosylase n=1 Tax=Aequorivita sublithincola (strain DSM 14238 / LMG 21431 / ACAM 643 / 9-3) TaxID=746697 RepID=I3YV27_AEQSU|nr:A/G-specific adenine glycosylase [Aequorivita sublithincola]AFL80845.1 A/G-specific DNA-adenine glycosylase [Aequorivita sublithincola DSM 14238]
MPKKVPHFSKILIAWYLQNKRDLPWRNTTNPYRIWLSEIMLQQTRVLQGLPYYLKFVEAYPKVEDLANAPEDDVLKLWQGLGYYSRARNLHATAKIVSEEMNGTFPNNYNDLLKLKGVGDYTASAIASISFNQPEAVVDGNVYRVLSRYFGIPTPINTTPGQKEFKQLAQQLIDKKEPGTFNQAIMEFGARFCVPQSPDCGNCIFNDSCVAFQQKKVTELPVKIKAKPVKNRFFNYLVVLSENERTILQQRTGKGIWQKLYEFPLIETSEEINISELQNFPQFRTFSENLNIENISLFNEKPVIHKLSHQHLNTRFWIVETSEEKENTVPISEVKNYAVPVLIADFVSEFFENY